MKKSVGIGKKGKKREKGEREVERKGKGKEGESERERRTGDTGMGKGKRALKVTGKKGKPTEGRHKIVSSGFAESKNRCNVA